MIGIGMTYSDDGNVGDIVGSHDRDNKCVRGIREEFDDIKTKISKIDF